MSSNEFDIKSIRLLLVEDNPADAREVERHLKDAGLNDCSCDWVQTAGDAAQRLQTVEYELVLLALGLAAVRVGAQDYLEKRRVNAGRLSRFVSYSVERSAFHRDLVRATRRYQDLFNNVPVALFTAERDGRLKTANAAFVKLIGSAGVPVSDVIFLDLLYVAAMRTHF